MSKFLDDNGLLYLVQKIKTWLSEKADSSHTHTVSDLTDYSEYELPTASSNTLGGIKVGAGLEISDSGTLSATGGGTADSVAWDNITDKPDFADVATSGSYNDLSDTPTIPTAVSSLTNDSGYQTASDVSSAITDALADITSISYSVVTSLPSAGEAGVIYLLANEQTETSNIYDEYIYVNSAFEKIGTTAVDLSGYLTEDDVEAITNSEIDTICA